MILEKGRHDLIYGLQNVKRAEMLELCENRLFYVGHVSFLNTFYYIDTKLCLFKTVLEVIFMTILLF